MKIKKNKFFLKQIMEPIDEEKFGIKLYPIESIDEGKRIAEQTFAKGSVYIITTKLLKTVYKGIT